MVAERNGKKVYDETTVEADMHLHSINKDEEFHYFEDDLEKSEGEMEEKELDEMEKKMRKKRKKRALLEFRCRVEDAIIGNYLLGKPNRNTCPKEAAKAREQLKEITLWGVPLLPSKGHEGTDVLLQKFLKAKHYKVHEAFEMLRKTLKWRKDYKADGILEEKLGGDLQNLVGFLEGKDREGHPLWFNANGVLKDREMYQKTFGSEEKCEEFLRWMVQNMEKGIKQLRFEKGGVDSIVQITDLKNSPGPAMKEFRSVSKKALLLLQDHYPELVYKNIVINAPFWYYARHILRSKIISHKTKAKFVFASPSKVTKTLLKFIAPEQLPVRYGGLKRDDDDDFSPADKASELSIKGNFAANIEFPVTEPGVTMVWDVTVVGWDVVYKEEFVPEDEGSYRIQLQNQKKVGESLRNCFYISEPGKIVITIENPTFNHKKTVYYRSKTKPTVPMYILFNK
ncbi:patellin-4-like [Benincasa hispida]|uniref:patellin-4-like n=1 Tax=Benincasa hispida TaxID=102211 RepID=UPI0019022DA1|nr:patellin-4-like [Benincasa hispida]